jgi:hypothetical protein
MTAHERYDPQAPLTERERKAAELFARVIERQARESAEKTAAEKRPA